MADEPGNQTPNTPDVSETDLRGMTVDELREEARQEGLPGTSGMRKAELVDAVAEAKQGHATGSDGSGDGPEDPDEVGAGPDGGRIRTGPETSKSLKYSQEITSPDEDPEREGRSLATTHHEVIKQWAESRGARPAAVEGTDHGDHLGVLRLDFNEDTDKLRHVSWDEWFRTFDERRLNFVYQEQRKDGKQSNFFILESPDREDA
ncbi:Rho termination factor N-terminal domain-containing protein [Arthrobacter sp. Soc17.1.1.1]|uniref:Rho termination factor N-terminal domain-containing protein n=1 Tax=Arthrobacter sp. Soc17.1.1.1 TaxID=3121277 RepID=UPI002FE4C89F